MDDKARRSPVSFDKDAQVIRLEGSGGLAIMLTFLLKAKFGEAYDSETLFHRQLAELARDLQAALPATLRRHSDRPFADDSLFKIATEIVLKGWQTGWWSMSRDERIAYVQDVVVAPHRLSDAQLDTLLEGVETVLFNQRRIVSAADEAGEP